MMGDVMKSLAVVLLVCITRPAIAGEVKVHWDDKHPRPRIRVVDADVFDTQKWHDIRVTQGLLPDPETLATAAHYGGLADDQAAAIRALTPGYAPIPRGVLRRMGDLGRVVQYQQTSRAIQVSRARARASQAVNRQWLPYALTTATSGRTIVFPMQVVVRPSWPRRTLVRGILVNGRF